MSCAESGIKRLLYALTSLAVLAMLGGPVRAQVAAEDYPRVRLVYTAIVTVAPMQTVGKTVKGTQRIIPITGGTFEGPNIRGTIVPGGADWNLLRSDGANEVEAYYFLRTDDGVLLKIVNKGAFPAQLPPDATAEQKSRPKFTTPVFEAPAGKYEWLNQGTFIGTLKVVPAGIQIGVFQVI